jgi:hypothetical protein
VYIFYLQKHFAADQFIIKDGKKILIMTALPNTLARPRPLAAPSLKLDAKLTPEEKADYAYIAKEDARTVHEFTEDPLAPSTVFVKSEPMDEQEGIQDVEAFVKVKLEPLEAGKTETADDKIKTESSTLNPLHSDTTNETVEKDTNCDGSLNNSMSSYEDHLEDRLRHLKKKSQDMDKVVIYLQSQLKETKATLKVANDKIKHYENTPFWTSPFNDDQKQFLRQKSAAEVFSWSDETIQTAKELMQCCGELGYEKLLQLGYPLPSVKTICDNN